MGGERAGLDCACEHSGWIDGNMGLFASAGRAGSGADGGKLWASSIAAEGASGRKGCVCATTGRQKKKTVPKSPYLFCPVFFCLSCEACILSWTYDKLFFLPPQPIKADRDDGDERIYPAHPARIPTRDSPRPRLTSRSPMSQKRPTASRFYPGNTPWSMPMPCHARQ